MSDFQFVDFTGGLNYRDTWSNIGSEKKVYWLTNTKNVRPYKNYGVTRMQGNINILGTAHTEGFLAIGKGYKLDEEFACVVDTNGDFYEVDILAGTLSSVLLSGLDATEKGIFVPLDNALLYSNGFDDLFYYYPSRETSVSGTCKVESGDLTAVIGTNTSFLAQLQVGDQIVLNSETRTVATITDNTHLTVTSAFTGAFTGEEITRNRISFLLAEMTIGSVAQSIRGKAVEFHNDRVWVGCGNTLFWSALGIYSDWETTGDDGAGYYANFGSDISAIKSYKGYLLVYLANGFTYILSGTTLATEFQFSKFFDKTCKSPFGVLTANNDQYFYDNGVFTVSQVGELNQIRLTDEKSLSINNDNAGFLNGLFDTTREDEIFSLYNKDLREIWFFFPVQDASYFTNVFIYNFEHKQWFRRVTPQKVTDAIYYDNYIYTCTDDGEILREENREDFNGTAIEWIFSTQFFNFGDLNKTKDIDELYFTLDTVRGNDFDYKFQFNYNDKSSSQTIPIKIDNAENLIWDSGTWDSYKWAVELEQSLYGYIFNGNRSLQLTFMGGAGQNIGLIGLEFRGVALNAV